MKTSTDDNHYERVIASFTGLDMLESDQELYQSKVGLLPDAWRQLSHGEPLVCSCLGGEIFFGFGLNAIMSTIHIYPTMSEANKYAAGVWKKARQPEGALKLLEKFHTWRRNS